ncbi:MAG: type IV secretory system conjugative DNA transfer family protein [Oscillospiraceae bacterium]|nr:type IV secretory system conjugative DNA transfer family protein [Oscillospiraceae bacterium]
MSDPFRITVTEVGIRTALLTSVTGTAVTAGLAFSGKNLRTGEEHGSARWGNAAQLNRRYRGRKGEGSKILTSGVSIGMDSRRHGRNLNVLVIGGSGSGKTRFYALPNVMQMDSSMIVLDPKGEALRNTGRMLRDSGFTVRVVDLINMDRSHCYNPFVYLRTDADVQRLVTNLFQNTRPRNSQTQDPFWDQAAQMLLLAIMFYLLYEAPEEEQNFSTVMEMARAGDVPENNDSYVSPLDVLFERLEMKDPDHIALKYYRSYRSGSAKTLKSIQITLMSRLEKFNLESLAGITCCDELELDLVGDRKSAIFAVIPDDDSSFNFLIGMLYTQLFQQLYRRADRVYGGRLPVHVHFIMDEFANVALPDQFEKVLSTMRSREISVSMIIQNLSQLRALFDRHWESIVGNADEFLYLGGNEQSTYEFVSKLLGRETIDVSSRSRSRGRGGSWSESWQRTGRELLSPDEVRMLDNRHALLFIRGERPVKDLKYDIRKHPSYRLTGEGGSGDFPHGSDVMSIAGISAERRDMRDKVKEEEKDEKKRDLIILTEEEMEELFRERREDQIRNDGKE